jgi:hypothetical protein
MSLGGVASLAGSIAGDLLGKLDKAYLAVYKPTMSGNPKKPAPAGEDQGRRIKFLFNPKDFSFSKEAHIQRGANTGAKGTPPPHYNGPGPRSFTVELFFDKIQDPTINIVKTVEKLFDLCEPDPSTVDTPPMLQPFVMFCWGSFQSKPSHVKSVNAKFHMFLPTGIPMRATCSVSLQEANDEDGSQNPTSGSKDARRSHTVLAGETLASVAYLEFRKASMWRAIAAMNDIDDPLRVGPGTVLYLPTAAEAAALA